MHVGIIGAGNVGEALGRGLAAAGHQVTYGVRSPDDDKYAELHDHAALADVAGCVAASDAVILATPWRAAQEVVESVGDFGGRPLIDATNPIAPGFTLAHGHTHSGAEQVALWAKNARVVKAFNTTGAENMVDPQYGDHRVAMFVCGDDEGAVEVAMEIARAVGFDAVNVGPLKEARLIEPLAMVWITLAMRRGLGRDFAFGLLRR